MDDPSAWNMVIGRDSDPEAIKVIQKRLVEWKWLAKGDYKKGSLDKATANAIADFQAYCVENGMHLEICDPADPLIETETLWLLFNADGNEIINPNA